MRQKGKILHIAEDRFKECNQPTCYKLELNQNGISRLLDNYEKVRGQARFIDDILHLKSDSGSVQLLKEQPGLIHWSQDGTALLLPNYPHADIEATKRNPKMLKNRKGGFELTGWYIHEKQLEETVFSQKENRDSFCKALSTTCYVEGLEPHNHKKRLQERKRIIELERESGTRYLTSIYDLQPEHLPWLKELKSETLAHLKKDYGIDPDEDHVELFFHKVPSIVTTHLHVRVNQALHELEASRIFKLDDVISCLEKGQSIRDCVVAQGPVYLDESEKHLVTKLQATEGIVIEKVANPFISNTSVRKLETQQSEPSRAVC